MNILAINTSSYRLGIALMSDEHVIGVHETYVKINQSRRAMPAIEQLMADVQIKPAEIDRIVVAHGPGSFTGIRIGVTIAKTMAWALDVPIVGVSTLKALAYQAAAYTDQVIVPFFDARRNRVYTGAYAWKDSELIPVKDEKNISMDEWLAELEQLNKKLVFLSPDMEIYEDTIDSTLKKRVIIPPSILHRVNPVHVALVGEMEDVQDVHTFTPEYLRLAEAEKKWQDAQEASSNE